ncbi:MAG TPA: glycosyltransferase [Longimicrobiales bacterium]|nr:glycosyltransferase [Longimicrobiales bacterium]
MNSIACVPRPSPICAIPWIASAVPWRAVDRMEKSGVLVNSGSGGGIRVAFTGSLPEPEDIIANPAYSPAAALFQEQLLEALDASAECEVSHVFAGRPLPSYPRHARIAIRGARASRAGRFPMSRLGFLNLGLLKPATLSLSLLPRVLAWAWRERARSRLILLYNTTSPPAIIAVLAGLLSRTQVVAIVADINVPGSGLVSRSLLRRLEYRLQVRTLRYLDGVVVLTERMRVDFAPRLPALLMEGAVSDTLLQDPLPGRASGTGACAIMYAGHLSALKGLPLLLEAFERLVGPGYELWLTGDGPMRPDVEAAAQRDPRIRYFGMLPYERVVTLLRRATVLVNPHSGAMASSRYLFPSKLLEFLASGRPVITTVSTPEVRQEYGAVAYLLEEESAEGLRAMIETVASLPERERQARGEAARMLLRERKTWRTQGARIAHFLARVVREGSGLPERELVGPHAGRQ